MECQGRQLIFADILSTLSSNASKNEAFKVTAEVYLWRIKKYLGSYLAVVGNPHAVIFTDTIGETVPAVRLSVCSNMETFGLKIDEERNKALVPMPFDVATDDSPVRILVVQTNEEIAIARQTYMVFLEKSCIKTGWCGFYFSPN